MHCTKPLFRSFDVDAEVRVYSRHLPHWRQPGATYSVTFRLADSIPTKIVEEWQDIRNRWLKANGTSLMSTDSCRFLEAYRKIPQRVRNRFERKQARMLHDELDKCHGSCILQHKQLQTLVDVALHFFHARACASETT